MDLYKTYGTDEDLETEGVWTEWTNDSKVKLGRIGGVAFNRVQRQKMRRMRTGFRADSEMQDKILVEVLAETVLLDWKGFVDADGKALKYSKDAAVKVLTDLPTFRDDIVAAASDMSLFQAEDEADAEKNSPTPSSGSSKSTQSSSPAT